MSQRHTRIALLVMVMAAVLWIGGFAGFSVYVGNMSKIAPQAPADAIIVLTGGPQRINTGLELLSVGHAQKLFITGVNDHVTLEKILSLWPGHLDNAAARVVLGHRARNTAENAVEAMAWAQAEHLKSAFLITSNYHMPRALMEFRHALPDVEINAYPVIAADTDPEQGTFWREAFAEYNKTILAWLRLTLLPEFVTDRMNDRQESP